MLHRFLVFCFVLFCFNKREGSTLRFNCQGCVSFRGAQPGVGVGWSSLPVTNWKTSTLVKSVLAFLVLRYTWWWKKKWDGRHLSTHILFDSPGHRTRPHYPTCGDPRARLGRLSKGELEDDCSGSKELGASPDPFISCQGPFSRSLSILSCQLLSSNSEAWTELSPPPRATSDTAARPA